LPDARREVLTDAGHLACLDDPDAYAATVLKFVADADSPETEGHSARF
jgi:pimeloyl-ACP methyl ester carboxylesterase